MHELSIAMQIVESVSSAVDPEPSAADTRVAAVNIRVGAMSGVVPEALRFAWDMATDGTVLAGSELRIEEVAAAVWCPSCADEVEIDQFRMKCPVCQTPTPRVVRGRELDILSLELSDERYESAPASNP